MTTAALFRIESNRASLVFRAADAGSEAPAALCESDDPPLGTLAVRALRAGAALRVVVRNARGEATDIAPGETEGPRLFEHASYLVYARSRVDHAAVSLEHEDPIVLAHLASEDGGRVLHGRVSFGPHPGRSRFVLRIGAEPEFAFDVQVFPTRLDYATDYAALLREVEDAARGLALELLRPSTQPSEASLREPAGHVAWVAHLGQAIAFLEQSAAQIAHRPRAALRLDEPTLVRAEQVRRPDAATRAMARRARAGLDGAPGHERLPDRRPRPALDTTEHRWIATQLASARRRIELLRAGEAARPAGVRRDAVVRRLEALAARVAQIERAPPFAATHGAPPPPGFASLTLMSAPGYAESYQLLSSLGRALTIEGGALDVSLKDTGTLYETWCYLALLAAVARATGQRVDPRELIEAREDGLRFRLARGRSCAVAFAAPGDRTVTVTYNPRFEHAAAVLGQQPDLLLAIDAPGGPSLLVVLDAKYRLDASPEAVARHGVAAPPDDALAALHRYRDAILAGEPPSHPVLFAAAIYPLRVTVDFAQTRLARALERGGVGAIPAVPGATHVLDGWIARLLARGAISLAERAVPSAPLERVRALRALGDVRVDDAALRWTSALAAERARGRDERWLATLDEWRLYEDLRAAGASVALHPAPEHATGRVWLAVDERRARYVGDARFATAPEQRTLAHEATLRWLLGGD